MIKHVRPAKQHKNSIKKDNSTSLKTIIELNTTNSTKELTKKWANMKDTWLENSFQTLPCDYSFLGLPFHFLCFLLAPEES